MTVAIYDRKKTSSSYVKMKIAVVFILLLAWWLQLHQLQTNSLLADEVASYNRATLATWSEVYQEYIASGHTPLYEWIILRNWLRFVGEGNLLSRIPTLFISMITLGLTYALGRRVTAQKVAITAVFLTAISPLFLQHSREIRPYMLMSLTSMFALYMWLRALQTEQWKYWIGFTIGSTLMIYTHYYAFFLLTAIGLVTIIHVWHTKDARLLRPFSLSVLIIVLLFIPWAPVFFAKYANGAVEWIAPLTWTQIYYLPTTFINHMNAPQHISAGSGSLMVALIIWLSVTIERLRPKWLIYVTSILLLTVTLSAIMSIVVKPLFIARYFMGVVPIFALMLSWGLWYLQPKWLVGIVYAPLLILMLLGTGQLATLQRESSWESAIAYVQKNDDPTDVLLVVSPETWTINSFYHYCRECEMTVHSVRGSLKNEEQIEAWVQQYAQHDRIWLIQSARSHDISLQPQPAYAGYTLQDRVSFEQDLISHRLGLVVGLVSAE